MNNVLQVLTDLELKIQAEGFEAHGLSAQQVQDLIHARVEARFPSG